MISNTLKSLTTHYELLQNHLTALTWMHNIFVLLNMINIGFSF